jgi:hypothetical protein
MSTGSSRGKTILIALLMAGGLGYGSAHFAHLAFGQHDAAPESIALAQAAAQPENKWATLRGKIDPRTLVRVSHPLGQDQVAFRLEAAGDGLVVVTNTARHPALGDEALWQPHLLERLAEIASGHAPDKLLQPATVQLLETDQTFTGVITEPGSGMNEEGYVELDGDKLKVTGLVGSYCSHVASCPAHPKVLLVGAQPRGRWSTLAASFALGLLALLFLAVALKRPATA